MEEVDNVKPVKYLEEYKLRSIDVYKGIKIYQSKVHDCKKEDIKKYLRKPLKYSHSKFISDRLLHEITELDGPLASCCLQC